jgi:hypothetical protein
VDRILTLNGLQGDWPLQIGQKLLIDPGHITPSPTLSNIQKLTPEVDGNYYHTIGSGETLYWIADLYEVPLADLMAWNGLNNTSVIYPGQKLILRVTPPATPTSTQSPITITPSPPASMTQPVPTGTPATESESARSSGLGLTLVVTAIVIGALLWTLRRFLRKRQGSKNHGPERG